MRFLFSKEDLSPQSSVSLFRNYFLYPLPTSFDGCLWHPNNIRACRYGNSHRLTHNWVDSNKMLLSTQLWGSIIRHHSMYIQPNIRVVLFTFVNSSAQLSVKYMMTEIHNFPQSIIPQKHPGRVTSYLPFVLIYALLNEICLHISLHYPTWAPFY